MEAEATKEEVIALVPWIDFMNHDPDSKAYVAGTRDAVLGPLVLLKTDRPYKGHLARQSWCGRSHICSSVGIIFAKHENGPVCWQHLATIYSRMGLKHCS